MSGRFEYTEESYYTVDDKNKKKKYSEFKKENGFTPDETFNINETIAKFALPRMKHFRNNLHGFPSSVGTMKDWETILDKIITAMELIQQDPIFPTDDYEEKIANERDHQMKEGFELFGKYYLDLWD